MPTSNDIPHGDPGRAAGTPYGGIRVLDLSESIAGQYCTRLMAEHGAAVTLLEPLDGSVVRRFPPFSSVVDASGHGSVLFWHLNSAKRSVRMDWAALEVRDLLAGMARECDVAVVQTSEQSALVREANPHAVRCTVSPFRGDGPRSHWKGNELVYQALGGCMSTTGSADQPPLYGLGHRASYATGVLAYVCVTAALYRRWQTGDHDEPGESIAIDAARTSAAMSQNLPTVYFYNRSIMHRGSYPGLLARIRCRDGWVAVFALRHWRELCTAFDVPELADDPDFATRAALRHNWPRAVEVFRSQAATRSADDIVRAAQSGKACVERINQLTDVLDSRHFSSRGFWEKVETPTGALPVLGPVFRMSATPRWIPVGAPAAGEHTAEELSRHGLDAHAVDRLRRTGAI